MIISVHEYRLRPGVEAEEFERACRKAERDGLLSLPGLQSHHFLRGVRGTRKGEYAAIWVYESEEAWERLWGPVGEAVEKGEYVEAWRTWEEEILRPLLATDPDRITFTSYRVLEGEPDPREGVA